MNRVEEFGRLIQDNISAEQKLSRKPEPESVTENEGSVNEYNQVLRTNLAANYSVVMDLLYRTLPKTTKNTALELCCGPGLLTLSLVKYLKFASVEGIDMSQPMIRVAKKNASDRNAMGQVSFTAANVLKFNTKRPRIQEFF